MENKYPGQNKEQIVYNNEVLVRFKLKCSEQISNYISFAYSYLLTFKQCCKPALFSSFCQSKANEI